MDVFANEGLWPTRNEFQEEEESAAPTARDWFSPPDVKWSSNASKFLQDGKLKPKILVVGTSKAGAALLQQGFASQQELGSIESPEAPASTYRGSEEPLGPSPSRPQVASLYGVSEDPLVVVAPCGPSVPEAAASTWTKAVMSAIEPDHVVVLGVLQAEQYVGEGDPSQDQLVLTMQTTAAREDTRGRPVAPYVPSGNVVGGLGAALMTYCELRGIPAQLLVVVEFGPFAVPAEVVALVSPLRALLEKWGAAVVGHHFGNSERVQAAQRAVDIVEDRCSVYV